MKKYCGFLSVILILLSSLCLSLAARAGSFLPQKAELIQRQECSLELPNTKKAFLILSDYSYRNASLPIFSYTGTVQFLSNATDSYGDCEFLSPIFTPEGNRLDAGVNCKFKMDDGSNLTIQWLSQPAGLPAHSYSISLNASDFEGPETINCVVLN